MSELGYWNGKMAWERADGTGRRCTSQPGWRTCLRSHYNGGMLTPPGSGPKGPAVDLIFRLLQGLADRTARRTPGEMRGALDSSGVRHVVRLCQPTHRKWLVSLQAYDIEIVSDLPPNGAQWHVYIKKGTPPAPAVAIFDTKSAAVASLSTGLGSFARCVLELGGAPASAATPMSC